MSSRHTLSESDRSALLRRCMARYQPLLADFPGEWEAFVAALQRPLPGCVWAHPDRLDRPALVELIRAEEAG
ncbi:hypothetical protein CCR91_18850, partial [Thiorhodovibrio winogradskyi]|nr:hypothetical protein [Thiorhodovibrio winogradskyi]